jgi:formylglycine-generating enzyme
MTQRCSERTAIALVGSMIVLAAACSKKSPADTIPPPPPPAPTTVASVSANATPSALASSGAANYPVVSIPAGTLVAGTACGEHPRVADAELPGSPVEVQEFNIDAYPYPNDPAQPPMVNVTRSEAKQLCEARERRLCTELEWERACKGPTNKMYEYGAHFDPKVCPTGFGPLRPAGSFESCKSGFGVAAMHGFVWEWTASDWGRGTPESLAATRGGFGDSPYAHMRCANGSSRAPDKKGATVGFRCCGGSQNTAAVDLPLETEMHLALEQEASIDVAMQRLLKGALSRLFKDAPDTTYRFARLWYWRPVAHELLLIAEYEGKPSSGQGDAFVVPVVFQQCPKVTQVLARTKGPVPEMAAPEAATPPTTATIRVKSGTQQGEVKLRYFYGQVLIDEPPWIKAGSSLDAPAASAPASVPDAAPSSSR